MKLDKILYFECLNLFSYLPFEVAEDESKISIQYNSSLEPYTWKNAEINLQSLELEWPHKTLIQISQQTIVINKSSVTQAQDLKQIISNLTEMRELLLKENLQAQFWKHPEHIHANGFEEGKLPRSEALLEELSRNKLMVKEKKRFVVDLWKSNSSYLVADEKEHYSFQDAAAQIASLAIGHNHRSRNALMLRPELKEIPDDYSLWDVSRAFKRILKSKSQLENVYLVNSGAEAMETALRSCQTHYPQRRKILAFEGSFHGRTLLALHATHSPAKRLPFEIYSNLVSFIPYPEDKTPHIEKLEPTEWIKIWAQSGDSQQKESFRRSIEKLIESSDPLLKAEIDSLLKIRSEILNEVPLAVVVEPMQCEGGDRYASTRFYRALRILTRSHDVALVMDEVQCGFGLGGPFFWHSGFNLIDEKGNEDHPDAIYVAKKAQVGACITRFSMNDFKEESCPASIHRGYIQAIEILEHSSANLEKTIRHYLEIFQKHVGSDNVLFPRNQGYAFSFDLASPAIMNSLVGKRFPKGLLFYPAGDQTVRFRMWVGIQEFELIELFSSLFKCFEELQKDKLLSLDSDYESFIHEFPQPIQEKAHGPSFENHLIWPDIFVKNSITSIQELAPEKWDRAYYKVVSAMPQVLHLSVHSNFSLVKKPKDIAQLVDLYSKNSKYTRLDLMWDCARFFGTQVVPADTQFLSQISQQIDELQTRAYEPARQTPSQEFIQYSHNSKSVVHVAFDDEDGTLIGISGAAPITLFSSLPLLDHDPEGHDEACLYSYDLTLDTKAQGKGLGFRFKCEQMIEALRMGCHSLKSRNRYPEAKTMARLNLRLSGVITDVNNKDYGGSGKALYQSISLRNSEDRFQIGDLLEGSLKNKMTLSNFVSRHFIRDTQILAEHLPNELRHIYYASGRTEAVDKSLRLLRYFRPQATQALSFEGSYFGQSTACARSLGGPWGHKYFDWPVFENARELEQFLNKKPNSDNVLGFYAESPDPNSINFTKKIEELKNISKLCKTNKIPFLLAEYKTAFWKASKESFCLAQHTIPCDALLLFAGHQLGVLAVQESLFLDKPLMLISTWEGDEWSLALLKHKLIQEMPN